MRGGAEVIGVEFVEAGAAEAEFFGGNGGGDFVAAESGEEFADQGSAETMSELTIMFFKAARMRVRRAVGERGPPAPAGLPSACATLRPPPGPQGRECSPLLATRQEYVGNRSREMKLGTRLSLREPGSGCPSPQLCERRKMFPKPETLTLD